jgi:hypothetical protein
MAMAFQLIRFFIPVRALSLSQANYPWNPSVN